MDDTLLTNVLIDNNGAVDVEALASLLQRIRKVVGVSTLTVYPGSMDAHAADHLVTGLSAPERRELIRRDTGQPFHFYRQIIEVDGEDIKVVLHCAETAEEVARGEVARGQ